MEFLKGIAAATVEAAHLPPGAIKMLGGVNTTGIPLITPGGRITPPSGSAIMP